jgi:hypothetical protein
MSTSTICHPRRELAYRASGGIKVTLYWSAHDNTTTIEVQQPASGETLVFDVPGEGALDAFYHPFAYLPSKSASQVHDLGAAEFKQVSEG